MAFQPLKGGTPAARTKLNALVNEVNVLANLQGDGRFIAVRKGPGGTTVSLNIDAVMARVPKYVPQLFLVQVINDGGAAGNKTTPCTWTYAIYDMLGEAWLDSAEAPVVGQTPDTPRTALGEYVAAGDGSPALAYYDPDGVFHLYHCGEVPAVTVCPE